MDWYNVWQQRHCFLVENNVLKKQQFVFTPFIKVNDEGFLNADFRTYLIADSLARYYRYKNLRVLHNIGFDTLAYTSFMASKQKGKILDDKLSKIYLQELENLGVGYIKNKLVSTRNKDVIYLIDKIFLYFYNKGFIKYKDLKVYHDDFKVYDEIELIHKEELKEEKVFTLDFKKYINEIVETVSNLSIDNELKNKMLACFKPYDSLYIDLYAQNNKKIELFLAKPEELGALTAIMINPKYEDILEYIAPEEIFALESFLVRKTKKYLYTGNYVINPLTGRQIPIFLGEKYNEAIKPLFSTCDSQILYDLDIVGYDIYEGNYLINSDFLNGLTKEEAREKLVETFVEEGMARKIKNYAKTDILISNLDPYGASIPLALVDDNLVALDKNIPIYFDESFKKNYQNSLPINAELVKETLNSLFCQGIEIILNILYDNMEEVNNLVNKDSFKELAKWLEHTTLIIKKDRIIPSLLLPIIILTIVSKEEKLSILENLEIVVTDNVYDDFGNVIKKSSNNCIKINDVIASYGKDAIRLYYLHNKVSDPIYFTENKIFSYKQFLNKIKAIYNKGFLTSNYNLEFPFYQLKNKLYDALVSLDFSSYITYIEDFVKTNLESEQMTKKQASEFAVLLSIVAPYLAEEINYTYLNSKELLFDKSWPI